MREKCSVVISVLDRLGLSVNTMERHNIYFQYKQLFAIFTQQMQIENKFTRGP